MYIFGVSECVLSVMAVGFHSLPHVKEPTDNHTTTLNLSNINGHLNLTNLYNCRLILEQ